jgi:hypothetical protein
MEKIEISDQKIMMSRSFLLLSSLSQRCRTFSASERFSRNLCLSQPTLASRLSQQNCSLRRFSTNPAIDPQDTSVPPPPPPPSASVPTTNDIKRSKLGKKQLDARVVSTKKSNIDQSPLKMRFLVQLVRNKWVPDALAQMKFTPKRKGIDIAKIIRVRYFDLPTPFFVNSFFSLERMCIT